MLRNCPRCHNDFESSFQHRKYCSFKCAQERIKEFHRRRNKENPQRKKYIQERLQTPEYKKKAKAYRTSRWGLYVRKLRMAGYSIKDLPHEERKRIQESFQKERNS